jgi:hypothetical protein
MSFIPGSYSTGVPLNHQPLMPSAPTSHKVGSWERIEVMRLRAEAGEELWHPDDEREMATLEDQEKMKIEVNRLFILRRGIDFCWELCVNEAT